MTSTDAPAAPSTPGTLSTRLRHVRWLAGGTGSGKTTIAATLADRFGCDVYSGDRAEHDWLTRCSSEQHPHLAAARKQRPGDSWRGRTPEEAFAALASLHSETIGFLTEDLCARRSDRIVLVDYWGVLPRDLAPLLSWPDQAVFLIPTPDFRRTALTRRYADPDRARTNWGDLDPATVLEMRLTRDALWDDTVRRQADELNLPALTISEAQTPTRMIDDLAARFRLPPRGPVDGSK